MRTPKAAKLQNPIYIKIPQWALYNIVLAKFGNIYFTKM
jgi:hypothetical protein